MENSMENEAADLRKMTKGEAMVRMDFNPGANQAVAEIKANAANLIDLIETHKNLDPRLACLAQTAIEEAAMWGVKLVTTPAPSGNATTPNDPKTL